VEGNQLEPIGNDDQQDTVLDKKANHLMKHFSGPQVTVLISLFT
jgi:hypothetical protein